MPTAEEEEEQGFATDERTRTRGLPGRRPGAGAAAALAYAPADTLTPCFGQVRRCKRLKPLVNKNQHRSSRSRSRRSNPCSLHLHVHLHLNPRVAFPPFFFAGWSGGPGRGPGRRRRPGAAGRGGRPCEPRGREPGGRRAGGPGCCSRRGARAGTCTRPSRSPTPCGGWTPGRRWVAGRAGRRPRQTPGKKHNSDGTARTTDAEGSTALSLSPRPGVVRGHGGPAGGRGGPRGGVPAAGRAGGAAAAAAAPPRQPPRPLPRPRRRGQVRPLLARSSPSGGAKCLTRRIGSLQGPGGAGAVPAGLRRGHGRVRVAADVRGRAPAPLPGLRPGAERQGGRRQPPPRPLRPGRVRGVRRGGREPGAAARGRPGLRQPAPRLGSRPAGGRRPGGPCGVPRPAAGGGARGQPGGGGAERGGGGDGRGEWGAPVALRGARG